MTLGEKLYALRKKHGLSQEQLAESLKVSRQSISKWEGNVTFPEPDRLVAISEYFHVSLDYLMKADITDEHAGMNDEVPEQVQGSDEQRVERQTSENTEKPDKHDPLAVGLTFCVAGVIGLVLLGLITILLPRTSEQIGASSIISLNGTALLLLLCIGVMIVGATLIVRKIRRK